ARLVEAAIAIEQQRARQTWKSDAQERDDEDIVPEDLPVIALLPAVRRKTGIEVPRMRREGLQYVEAGQRRRFVRLPPRDLDRAAAPQPDPASLVRDPQIRERRNELQLRESSFAWLRNRRVPGGNDCRGLLDDNPLPCRDRACRVVRDRSLLTARSS